MKNIKDFGAIGNGIADDTLAIQSLLDLMIPSNPDAYSSIFIPAGVYLISAPLIVPTGVSIFGEGGGSIIQADFHNPSWTTDHRALVLSTIEGINRYGRAYNQVFMNFCVYVKPLPPPSPPPPVPLSKGIGIDIRTTTTIIPDEVQKYALLGGEFENIQFRGFDIAINLRECWLSNFKSLYIDFCRRGINIEGKCVNLAFTEIKMSNFFNEDQNSIGINIESGFYYTGGLEGRPEGITFGSGCAIFGAINNLKITSCLFFRISDSILDGAEKDCVIIVNPDNVSIKGCYIYTKGLTSKCIHFTPVNLNNSKISIEDNEIVGRGIGEGFDNYGIYFYDGPTLNRKGFVIESNFFTSLKHPMYFNRLDSSTIINNQGSRNGGAFLYLQEGSKNVIDGNTSDDQYPILALHPLTGKEMKIGANWSPTSKTSFKGFVTLLAGQTSVLTQNNMYTSELYYRVLTVVSPSANLGSVWVQNQQVWSEARINCSTAPATDTKIYYEAIAIPYSATQ